MSEAPPIVFLLHVFVQPFKASFTFFTLRVISGRGSGLNVIVLLLASPLQDKFQFPWSFRQHLFSFPDCTGLCIFLSHFLCKSSRGVGRNTKRCAFLYELCEESWMSSILLQLQPIASLNSLTNFLHFFFISTLGCGINVIGGLSGWQLPNTAHLFEFGLHLFKFLFGNRLLNLCAYASFQGVDWLNVTGSPICITSVKNVWSSTNCFSASRVCPAFKASFTFLHLYVWFPAAGSGWTSLVLLLASPLQDKFQFLGDFGNICFFPDCTALCIFLTFCASLLEVWAKHKRCAFLYELCEESLNVFYLFDSADLPAS